MFLPALRKWRSLQSSLTLIITHGLWTAGTIDAATSIPSFTAPTTDASAAQSMQSTACTELSVIHKCITPSFVFYIGKITVDTQIEKYNCSLSRIIYPPQTFVIYLTTQMLDELIIDSARLCYFCSSCSCWLPTSFFPTTVDVKSLLQQQALPIRLNSSSVQQHSAWLGPPIFTSHQHHPHHPGSLAAGVACSSWSQPKDTSPPVALCWCFPQAPPESLLDKGLSSNSLDHMHNI